MKVNINVWYVSLSLPRLHTHASSVCDRDRTYKNGHKRGLPLSLSLPLSRDDSLRRLSFSLCPVNSASHERVRMNECVSSV